MHPSLEAALERARGAETALARHQAAWFTAELALKLAAAHRILAWVRWADAAGHPRLNGLTRPSVGMWAGLFRDLGRTMAADGALRSERRERPAVAALLMHAAELGVVAAHQPRGAHRTLDDVFDALVTYRNRVIGHGAHRADAFYEGVADRLLAAVEEVAAEVEATDLAPLAIVHEGRFGMFDHLTRNGAAYLDYTTGATFTVPLADDLRALLGEPAGRPAAQATAPHRLPREVDAFVGRERAVADLADRASRHPMVTLAGPPGTGKTRLAIHAAWSLIGAFQGGAFFADLADAHTREGVLQAVATAFDVDLGKDPEVQLGRVVAGRDRVLLVLDNAEQVAEIVAELLMAWTDVASRAAFVVTSRQVLGVPGEQVIALDPLASTEAVDLFVARVQQRKRGFAVTDANRDAIGELVRMLDGLPLAVELAAARAAVIPAEKLLARMKDRWKVLSGAKGGRYATLRAAIDASWEALDAAERSALAQVSVFRGGFTLEAAEEVLELPDDAWAMDLVQQLVDKSLLRVWSPNGADRFAIDEPHFGLLVSIADYAAEQLRTPGRFEGSGPPFADAVEVRHGECFAAYGADDALDALDAHEGTVLRAALALEVDNLVVACRRAVDRGDLPTATATLRAAWEVLGTRGPLSLALDLARAVARLAPEEPTAAAAHARYVEGAASLALGSLGGAAEAQEQALWLFRQLGDGVGEARALASIANRHQRAGRNAEALEWNRKSLAVAAAAGHAQAHAVAAGATASSLLVLADSDPSLLEPAVEALQQAIAQLRSVGDRRGEGLYLSNLGLARRYTAPAEALTHYEDALVLLREGGAREAEGVALKAMADLQLRQGRLAEARPLLELALRIHREMGTRSSEGHLLLSLAALESQLGRGEEALALNRRALEIVRETGNVGVEPMVLANIGALSTTLGRADAGAEVERAIAVSEARGDRLIEGYARMFLAVVRAREGRSSDAWAELDRSESALAGLHHPVVDGHGHLCRAEIAWLTGDPDGARASLAAAEGFGVSDLDRDIARVRALLD